MNFGFCLEKVEHEDMIENFFVKNFRGGGRTTLKNIELNIFEPSVLLSHLENDKIVLDVVVLGIDFKEETFDGIYLAGILNKKLPDCQIIYLSGNKEFPVAVYETNHCYYIMEKDIEETFPKAIDKAIKIIEDGRTDNSFEIVCNKHTIYIFQHDIKFIERVGRTINIHTDYEVYSCYMTLSKACTKLGKCFFRCHGSFVVNISHIKRIESDDIYMDDGTVIPIGRTFKAEFKRNF